MPDLLVCGKVILDSLVRPSGRVVTGLLGGGGPQGALGARLILEEVGFLTRTGTDLDDSHIEALRALGVDLSGWLQFSHVETPKLVISYDEDQNMLGEGATPISLHRWEGNWAELLSKDIAWPESYDSARAIHLITESPQEQMVETALKLRERSGALISLEPIIDKNDWSNLDDMVKLVSQVDVVCPDLPAALKVAGGKDPSSAARYWNALGPSHVAVRAGSQGSFLAGIGIEDTLHVPAMEVEVIDPTGAGNAYAGGLIASLLAEANLAKAACNATAAASVMLENIGIPAFSLSLAAKVHSRAQTHYGQLEFN